MQISVHISDEILKAAETQQVSLTAFVEELIARGLEITHPRPALNSAIERIRALSAKTTAK